MCAPCSGKAVLAPLLPWQSAAAQKTRVEKLILAVNGLCDATLTHYGTKMGLLEGITGQGQGFAPCPSHPQHGARALRKRVPLRR